MVEEREKEIAEEEIREGEEERWWRRERRK